LAQPESAYYDDRPIVNTRYMKSQGFKASKDGTTMMS